MTTRRDTLAWLMQALAATGATPALARGLEPNLPAIAPGYGTDPNLKHPVRPWPLTLGKAELRTVTRLADLILPADETSPAASALGVPDFIDEWVSAPYPEQRGDRKVILEGLKWLDRAAGGDFAGLSEPAAGAILESICDPAKAVDRQGAEFFTTFRSVAMTGYYTTPEGWAAIGYVGNKPAQSFAGPPPEVLARIKV